MLRRLPSQQLRRSPSQQLRRSPTVCFRNSSVFDWGIDVARCTGYGRYSLRHFCQDSDGLIQYGWTVHPILDQEMKLATSFVKSKGEDSGYGGDWVVRLDVQNHKSNANDELSRSVHLLFYLADEDGNALTVGEDTLGTRENSLLASGSHMDIGNCQLRLKSEVRMIWKFIILVSRRPIFTTYLILSRKILDYR